MSTLDSIVETFINTFEENPPAADKVADEAILKLAEEEAAKEGNVATVEEHANKIRQEAAARVAAHFENKMREEADAAQREAEEATEDGTDSE